MWEVPAEGPASYCLPVPVRLRRKTRFAIRPGRPTGDAPPTRGVNGYAGSPPMVGIAPYAECTVECVGEPDPTSGYLINIKKLDDAVHERVRPLLEAACGTMDPPGIRHPSSELGCVLAEALAGLGNGLPVRVIGLTLGLSPYHAVSMMTDPDATTKGSLPDPAPTPTATVSLRFDFAASHRLHVSSWDEATNRDYFGKCNNPNGHGHNYQIEVRVAVPSPLLGRFPTDALERVVNETIITRFDHKHLNLDTEEFADRGGLNPTVENITRVCYDLLAGPVAELGSNISGCGEDQRENAEAVGVSLRSVRVWETDRTSSEYPA